jgi:hypothetical protein
MGADSSSGMGADLGFVLNSVMDSAFAVLLGYGLTV